MTRGLTQSELDFVQWMDEVDLDEVNLLDGDPTAGVDEGKTDAERERLSGEKAGRRLPPQRNVGWDEG